LPFPLTLLQGQLIAGLAARLAHEVALDLEDLRLAADVDVLFLQGRPPSRVAAAEENQ